ncbi:MAG: SDR family NAD(P)-dependent oxidoreductase [Acidimicrobiales bacterium]
MIGRRPGPTQPWASALVTGASAGIGAAFARRLGAAGVPTVVVARRAERLAALAEEHPSLEPLVADLAEPEGVGAVAARLADSARPVELLVNNAGFGAAGRFAEQDPARHGELVAVNVAALTGLTRAALPAMLAAGRGWILQVSSVAGFQPAPGAAVYGASKAYVTSLAEALSVELAGTGVRISALCPGFTRTEFHQVSGAGWGARLPGRLWMDADAVAAAGLRAAAAGRVIESPGAVYKVLAAGSSVLPRPLLRALLRIRR